MGNDRTDPHVHAARQLRAMGLKAAEAAVQHLDGVTDGLSRRPTVEEHIVAVRLAETVFGALYNRHLIDMQTRYGSAYGPWPRRNRAQRRGNRPGPRRRYRA